ncbi:hypothetical protein ABT063_20815 [Streptomyces sp. NPDC002838]|uniref:hypothetical protein n=1 Tax=Streptomyces sp. NPDC002838 TaxID=3154436 RepID=UPI003322149B
MHHLTRSAARLLASSALLVGVLTGVSPTAQAKDCSTPTASVTPSGDRLVVEGCGAAPDSTVAVTLTGGTQTQTMPVAANTRFRSEVSARPPFGNCNRACAALLVGASAGTNEPFTLSLDYDLG